jgi:hypothetical protein
MTIVGELTELIQRIDSQADHDACVRLMNVYLRKRIVQRRDQPEQAKRLYESFQTGRVELVREFELSQFGRIREQAANFIRMIENESHPGQVRVLRSEETHAS